MELLKDPDVFIGDTRATCDSTATTFGMCECREAVPNVDSIIKADNNCVFTKKNGALSGIMVDKNGNELSHLKLREVPFAPSVAYNLLSADAVKIANDAKKARFDCDDFDEMFEYVGCKVDRDYAESNKFVIKGEADSDYAKCPITRRSISGNVTRIEGVAIMTKSVVKKMVTPSVTESELYTLFGKD